MIDVNEVNLDRPLRTVVSIDDEDMVGEYSTVAHHLALWGTRYAAAQEAFLRAKLGRDHLEGRLRLTLRVEQEELTGKRVTEATLDALIKADERFVAAKVTEIEAEAESLRVRGILQALRAKADMLVSLGATQRTEMRAS